MKKCSPNQMMITMIITKIAMKNIKIMMIQIKRNKKKIKNKKIYKKININIILTKKKKMIKKQIYFKNLKNKKN